MNNGNLSCFAANPKFATRITYPNEKKHNYRDEFERDRDRIIYSNVYRRLNGKTQVFICGFDDNMRNRQTHTIEVVQIAVTIAKQLDLNIPLVEAIAHGHDLGHTPFGHAGERILNYIMNGCYDLKDFNKNLSEDQKGFKHNWQGIRVISELERYDHKYKGLNLTDFTMWGILYHTNLVWKECEKKIKSADGTLHCGLLHEDHVCLNGKLSLGFYNKYKENIRDDMFNIEAVVVAWADEIAQRHHDLEDGLINGIIERKDAVNRIKKIFIKSLSKEDAQYLDTLLQLLDAESAKYEGFFISDITKFIINFLVSKLIENSRIMLEKIKTKYKIESYDDFQNKKNEIMTKMDIINGIISFNKRMQKEHFELKEFLKQRILNSYIAQSMDGKSNYIIERLFKAYITNPQQLPDKTIRYLFSNYYSNVNKYNRARTVFNYGSIGYLREKLEKMHYTDDSKEYKTAVLRTICDFISGMTDNFAYQQYELLYGTQKFKKNY